MGTANTLFLTFALVMLYAGCTGMRPANIGVKDGRLAPCPSLPNCVSSQSTDPDHAAQPLTYNGTADAAMDDLRQIVRSMKRARIVRVQDGYLHAEFTSALFRFVDDVEFFINEREQRIEVRSASRLGRSDLGVNRKRVEEIRTLWNQRKKASTGPQA